ncbi:MAG: tRNA pseudouridine(55) synthase TruB [Desulfobacteraceae bacterium]|nr:MAG: tRNA pseudouridine(55) synthase TruB [Desulfobacteraceae bacterium]
MRGRPLPRRATRVRLLLARPDQAAQPRAQLDRDFAQRQALGHDDHARHAGRDRHPARRRRRPDQLRPAHRGGESGGPDPGAGQRRGGRRRPHPVSRQPALGRNRGCRRLGRSLRRRRSFRRRRVSGGVDPHRDQGAAHPLVGGDVNGILVVNKPEGLSSAQTVARVKHLLQAARAGHAGTLDPFARGVLICCINQATRLARFLLHDAKAYEAVMTLGRETDTQDLTGRVVGEGDWTAVTNEQLTRCLRRFEGTLSQAPPVYSALKHEGVPLYALARRGVPVQKPARAVRIDWIRLREVALPRVRFEVRCSAGTYVRTLCADIGRALGCGAHMSELTRTESGGFRIEQALSLEALASMAREGRADAGLIPMARALNGRPEVVADLPLLEKIRHGRRLSWEELSFDRGAPSAESFIKVVDARGELAAVLRAAPAERSLDYCCVFSAPGGS